MPDQGRSESVRTRQKVELMSDNPCLACPIDQGCCRNLDWMRLSPEEYERVYARVDDRMETRREGPFLLVRAKDTGACPHWDGHCTVYDERPTECRLYPQAIGSVFDGTDMVLSVQAETPCPWRRALRGSDDAAEAVVRGLGQTVARQGQGVRVVREEGFGKLEVYFRRLARKLLGFGRYADTPYRPLIDLPRLFGRSR